MNVVQLTVLSPQQYCVVVNAVGKDGRPRLGHRELRCGPLSFFLQPGMYIPAPGCDMHSLWLTEYFKNTA